MPIIADVKKYPVVNTVNSVYKNVLKKPFHTYSPAQSLSNSISGIYPFRIACF